MQLQIFLFLALFLFAFANAEIYLSSCARMDTPVLSKVAQGLCISSCKYQNCGTGSCKKRSGRTVCVCNRCANGGGEWPNVPSVSVKKGRK
ncbi:unnamed protein product [Enterobius vermicularis]|uniref:Uncharacterized protein n=1 Tax=Enterobius vermicularis TaxID=51028 RepID=A0A0N4VMJ3_ENTVE|nr:unnamed protein product [Enterobius vermicularis]